MITKIKKCPACGMEKEDWPELGRGVSRGNKVNCCKGCAEGTGCTCAKNPPSMEIESD